MRAIRIDESAIFTIIKDNSMDFKAKMLRPSIYDVFRLSSQRRKKVSLNQSSLY
jgi:hypothetical protein